MSNVIELVVYKIKETVLDTFKDSQSIIAENLSSFPGFVSFSSTQSSDDPAVRVDYVVWKSSEEAKAAAQAIQSKSEFAPLFEAIESVTFFGHVNEFATLKG